MKLFTGKLVSVRGKLCAAMMQGLRECSAIGSPAQRLLNQAMISE